MLLATKLPGARLSVATVGTEYPVITGRGYYYGSIVRQPPDVARV